MGGVNRSSMSDEQPDEDEWEYEYSTSETEDFYFTVDLTTHVEDALKAKAKARNGVLQTRVAEPVQKKPQAPVSKSKYAIARVAPSDTTVAVHPDENAEPKEPGTVQILELHTKAPVISFEGRTYSCYWMTDIGTQFHVSRPGVVSRSLRPGNVLDVIGISRARLLGKPITLERRTESLSTGTSVGKAIDLDAAAAKGTADDLLPGRSLSIPRSALLTPESRKQASFLQRLSAIKQKKRESVVVPTSRVKNYIAPENKEEIREKSAREEELRATARRDEAEREALVERPVKRVRIAPVEPAVRSVGGAWGAEETEAERARVGVLGDEAVGGASESPQVSETEAGATASPAPAQGVSRDPDDDEGAGSGGQMEIDSEVEGIDHAGAAHDATENTPLDPSNSFRAEVAVMVPSEANDHGVEAVTVVPDHADTA